MSRVEENVLHVDSVGDHSIKEGFAQMAQALNKSLEAFEASQVKNAIIIDLLKSDESRGSSELRAILEFLQTHLNHLNGRIGILVLEEWQFGMSRIFGTMVGIQGIEVKVSFDKEELMGWLKR